ncbi:MAG: hypothetical protein PWQ77_580 [Kosmotogales bacterium]|nr:hypothetical protein [Kosmotogales bacterium]
MKNIFVILMVFFLISITSNAFANSTQTCTVCFTEDASSNWNFEIDRDKGIINFSNTEYPLYQFEIDYDGTEDDKHYVGITPIIDGNRFETNFFYNKAPLLYPVLDPTQHDISYVEVKSELTNDVENNGDYFKVLFSSEDTYRLLRPVSGQNDNLFMEAAFLFTEKGLYIFLNGLYYILPSMEDTDISFKTNGEWIEKNINAETEASLEYYDFVTEIKVDEKRFEEYGKYDISTFINRLQIQVHNNSGTDGFEFDLDHSFKDRGQKEIFSKIFFPFSNEE